MESHCRGFKSVPWPTGMGAPDNEGVANTIRRSPNTIGYVDLNYALTTCIPYALINNSAGKFIAPGAWLEILAFLTMLKFVINYQNPVRSWTFYIKIG